MCSPGSEEGPVSVLAQRASHREWSWQGLSCMALLDFRGCIMHSCLVSGATFYPQASLDTFSMDLLDEKLYRWEQK